VVAQGLVEPSLDAPVRLASNNRGGTAVGASVHAILVEAAGLLHRRRVDQRDVSVRADQDQRDVAQFVQMRQGWKIGAFPLALVEPMRQDLGRTVGELLGGEPEELLARPGPAEGNADLGQRGPGEMNMRVDESGDDGGAGKLHQPVRTGRLPRPHPLDVPVVQQDPFPLGGMAEGADARRQVQGLHSDRRPLNEGTPFTRGFTGPKYK
jgi:hypothetical protein